MAKKLSFCLPPRLLAPLYEKPSGLFGNRSDLSFFPSVAQLPAPRGKQAGAAQKSLPVRSGGPLSGHKILFFP